MIKNIIFDLGGVITVQRKIDLESFDKKFCLKNGTVSKIASDCYQQKSQSKDFDELSYFKEKYEKCLSWEEYRGIINELNNAEELNKSLVDWIREKKDKYKIYLLTNNSSALEMLLEKKYKIRDIFHGAYNSYDLGVKKPDPKIFKHLLGDLGLQAKDCLFIDDDKANIESARDLGFSVLHYKSNEDFFSEIENLNW